MLGRQRQRLLRRSMPPACDSRSPGARRGTASCSSSLSSTTRICSPATAMPVAPGSVNTNVLPSPELALDPDPSAVQLDEALRQRQPEPGPLALLLARVGLLELLEDPRPGPPGRCPGPSSLTDTRTSPSTRAAATSTVPPAGVNFTAFDSRLKITCTDPALVADDRVDARAPTTARSRTPSLVARSRTITTPRSSAVGQRERRDLEVDLAGLDLREVEHVVDQRQQVARRGEDVVEVLGLLVVDLAEQLLAQHLREAADRVQRGPQLVRHVGQEFRLVAAGGLELAGLLVQLRQRAGQLAGPLLDLLLEPGIGRLAAGRPSG